MTAPQTISDFSKLWHDAILANELDEAEKYKSQTLALKAFNEAQPKVDAKARPQFGDTEQDVDALNKSAQNASIKAWYSQAAGGKEIDKDIETVLSEMYEGNYRAVRYAKAADFTRWIRSGNYNPALKSLVVYTPEQIMFELAGGMTVADLKAAQKATQLESQDTSGELALAA